MTNVAETLKTARGYIEAGWTRTKYYRDGRCCLLGAVALAIDPKVDKYRINDIASSQVATDVLFPLRLVYEDGGFDGIRPSDGYDEFATGRVNFAAVNDAQKTKKPILEWFDKAIKLAEG